MTIKNSTFGELTVAAALCSSAIMCASTASAAGFQLTEQSVAGMGRAHAGAGIVGDDVSAIHFNPAGMTLLHGLQTTVAEEQRAAATVSSPKVEFLIVITIFIN